ncbi:MAG: glutathione binding-like protein [Trichodesmium sp. St18_bin3_1_1]|nr:glutathione binding-like protein [Trichodesmium sp. St18_bin3_1_1]
MLNDRFLEDKSWLAGDKLSAADIAIYLMFNFFARLAAKEEVSKLSIDMLPIGQKYLRLGNLLQNIEQVLNVDGVYLPDWGEVCSQYLIFLLWEF